MCNSFAQTYSEQQNVANTFTNKATSCSSLSASVNSLLDQAANSNGTTNSADNCNSIGGALPQSAGSDPSAQSANGVNPNDPYGCQANPSNVACQSCTNNPSSPACQAMAAAAASGDQPTAGFQAAPVAAKDSNFNVGSPGGMPSQTQFGSFAPQTNKVTPVANNSGGGIPGSGGSAQQATLGGGARGPSAGSPGYNIDIDQGMLAGPVG